MPETIRTRGRRTSLRLLRAGGSRTCCRRRTGSAHAAMRCRTTGKLRRKTRVKARAQNKLFDGSKKTLLPTAHDVRAANRRDSRSNRVVIFLVLVRIIYFLRETLLDSRRQLAEFPATPRSAAPKNIKTCISENHRRRSLLAGRTDGVERTMTLIKKTTCRDLELVTRLVHLLGADF